MCAIKHDKNCIFNKQIIITKDLDPAPFRTHPPPPKEKTLRMRTPLFTIAQKLGIRVAPVRISPGPVEAMVMVGEVQFARIRSGAGIPRAKH